MKTVIKAVQNENDDLKALLKAAKMKEKLDNETKYEKEIQGLKEEINATSISIRKKDNEIKDLKGKVSSGKENEFTLEGRIGTIDLFIKDLQDEIDAKDFLIEKLSLEKGDQLKSSSDSLADKL